MPRRDLVPLEGPRAIVAEKAKERGMNLTELSQSIGKNTTYIQQWIKYNSPAKLPEDVRHELSRVLMIEEVELMLNPGQFRAPPQFVGQRDLPVYAAVEGGPGEMVVSTDPIDLVVRPWFLELVPDAYAVVVTGDSMEPVHEAGDIVLVNPKLPPIKGKDAIFVSEVHGGDFKASIKRFVRATEEHWVARQFNPPKGAKEEVRFSRRDWKKAIRVVGKYIP